MKSSRTTLEKGSAFNAGWRTFTLTSCVSLPYRERGWNMHSKVRAWYTYDSVLPNGITLNKYRICFPHSICPNSLPVSRGPRNHVCIYFLLPSVKRITRSKSKIKVKGLGEQWCQTPKSAVSSFGAVGLCPIWKWFHKTTHKEKKKRKQLLSFYLQNKLVWNILYNDFCFIPYLHKISKWGWMKLRPQRHFSNTN